MSVTNGESVVTKEILNEYHQAILPYLGGGGGSVDKTAMGYTPIGTIISVMGNTAPKHYLACNGSVVNILDYPELANYFNTQFGSKNYFGGDGVTTFAVPDLRGEFLRGAGTNSHTNQGNGANVGVHQDGTEAPFFGFNQETGDVWIQTRAGQNYGTSLGVVKIDASQSNTDTTGRYWKQTATFSGSSGISTYTSRPTNTSVLYCIATKNIYIDPKNNYSTEEQVVGTWIDGKPLYQKVFTGLNVSCASDWTDGIVDTSSLSVDSIIDVKTFKRNDGDILNFFRVTNQHTGTNLSVYNLDSAIQPIGTVIMQYTKTTD